MKKIIKKIKTSKYNIQTANSKRFYRIKLSIIDKQCRYIESIKSNKEELPF